MHETFHVMRFQSLSFTIYVFINADIILDRKLKISTRFYIKVWVIPYQFSKSSHMTPSELAEIWYVGSVCGFRKYLKIKTSYVVWLCGYSPLNIPHFVWFYCTDCYSSSCNFSIIKDDMKLIASPWSMHDGLSFDVL